MATATRTATAMLAALCVCALLAAPAAAQYKSRRVDNPDIPATSFSCVGRHNGYYADVETDCQVYHMCLDRQQFSYQCPNTTRFQQRMMVCDHWYQVDCSTAPLAYSANLLIGQRDQPFVGDDEHRALHEAAVRTSKGLLKGLKGPGKGLSQPSANALDGGAGKPLLSTRAPPAAPAPPSAPSAPSLALEAPFDDDEAREPRQGGFFQRSPSSSFAQPFQNQLTGTSSTSSTSSPGVTFTFTPPSTPAPPRFSISFTPSPSFPASGHNLQRPPPPSPSAATPTAFAPSAFSSAGPAPSVPAPFAPSATFAPSAPPSASAFAPSAPQVRTPSRELEAPAFDFSEPVGKDLGNPPFPSSAPAFSPSPSSPAPLFSASPSPFPSFTPEVMTAQQTSSFVSPFARPAASPPARELVPPHFFGSEVSAPGLAGLAPSSAPSAPSALGASGSFPRPFSPSNGTQRYSLFAVTAAPLGTSLASRGATPAPPSRELEAPPLDETETDFNTVELRYRDTRRLFFIPTADEVGQPGTGPSGQGDVSDPVVVIKYPTKATRSSGSLTAHLKSYSADVKRRVDPACPHCHPDFVVPGTCSPCVLLR